MRTVSDLTCQLVPVMLALIGSCSVGGVLAEDFAEDFGPAHVKIIITGPESVAGSFLNRNPPGRVLVAGNDNGTVFALVFGSDTDDAMAELNRRRVDGEVSGCRREGVTCCDEVAHSWVIDAKLEEEPRFWLRLGGDCWPVSVDDDWEHNTPGVDFEKVGSAIWQKLTGLGVNEPIMTLATEDHKLSVLVDPSWESSEFSRPRHLGLRTLSPAILVDHRNPNTQPTGPARPPLGCATRTPCYVKSDGRACYADTHPVATPHSERHHLYIHNKATDRWCEQVDKCNCPS